MPLPLPTMSYLTDIYFQPGSAKLLPELLAKFNIRRPLIVTDPGILRAGLLKSLALPDPIRFDQTRTNPTESSALAALALYRSENCDGLIALGGGAPIDLAKIIALLVHHPLPLEQYAIINGGVPRITPNIPPLIAIPTTAGSGSEVGRAALLTLNSRRKLGFLSPHLLPKAALCDPELTCSLPPRLTAATGMDAISHGIETFCSPRYNPIADDLALAALARGYHNIELATAGGNNLQARSEMLLCSLQAGLAFQKGLGAVHSLSHPLGALAEKQLHHGMLNALFLPHVLRFNAPAIPEKCTRISQTLAIPAADLPAAFTRLNLRLGLPATLTELGLTAHDLEPLAAQAAADHCSATNPRPLTESGCRELYLAAL